MQRGSAVIKAGHGSGLICAPFLTSGTSVLLGTRFSSVGRTRVLFQDMSSVKTRTPSSTQGRGASAEQAGSIRLMFQKLGLCLPPFPERSSKAQVDSQASGRRLAAPGAPVTHAHGPPAPGVRLGMLGSPCKPWVPLDVGPFVAAAGPRARSALWPAWRNWTPLNLLPCLSVQ